MIWLFISVAAAAALYVFVFGILSSVAHLALVLARKLLGRSPKWRWLIAGRSIAVIGALLVLITPHLLFSASEVKLAQPTLFAVWSAGELGVMLVAAVLVVILPLIEAWKEKTSSSCILASACLISFPLFIGFLALVSAWALSGPDFAMAPVEGPFAHSVKLQNAGDRAFFTWNAERRTCGIWMARVLSLPEVDRTKSEWTASRVDFDAHRAAFWFDTGLRGVTLEISDILGCSSSAIRLSTDSPVMASFVILLQVVYPAMFFGVLWVIFRTSAARLAKVVKEHVELDESVDSRKL